MTVSITTWSLARHFSIIRNGSGAETTPRSSQRRHARFSRLLTTTKYFAGSKMVVIGYEESAQPDA
jgi:hypothetical protein